MQLFQEYEFKLRTVKLCDLLVIKAPTCNTLKVINNIALLRQKQWWNFLGKIVKTLALVKTLRGF